MLSSNFERSLSSISKIISEIIPLLYGYFIKFIPHEKISQEHSTLSFLITYIIDETATSVRKKQPSHKFYRFNKKSLNPFVQTMLLVDFDGYICGVKTNIQSHLSNNTIPKHSKLFRQICFESGDKKNFVIGVTGFNNVDYCVSGLKINQIKTNKDIRFDHISREEQKGIEHINKFLKNFTSLQRFKEKEGDFIAIVMITCSLYNMKKGEGHYEKFKHISKILNNITRRKNYN